MPKLTIIAHLVTKPDKIEETKQFLLALTAATRAEPGCIKYDLHQDDNNPAEFTFYETWADRGAWDKHMQTPHIREVIARAPDLFAADIQVRQMTMISKDDDGRG